MIDKYSTMFTSMEDGEEQIDEAVTSVGATEVDDSGKTPAEDNGAASGNDTFGKHSNLMSADKINAGIDKIVSAYNEYMNAPATEGGDQSAAIADLKKTVNKLLDKKLK